MFVGLVYLWFRRGPYISGFYEPGVKNFWRSYWQIRPVSKHYQEYAVDGKGSDDIYFGESFKADKEDDGKILLRLPKNKQVNEEEEKEESKAKSLPIFDEEMPPTSRNLLN